MDYKVEVLKLEGGQR